MVTFAGLLCILSKPVLQILVLPLDKQVSWRNLSAAKSACWIWLRWVWLWWSVIGRVCYLVCNICFSPDSLLAAQNHVYSAMRQVDDVIDLKVSGVYIVLLRKPVYSHSIPRLPLDYQCLLASLMFVIQCRFHCFTA